MTEQKCQQHSIFYLQHSNARARVPHAQKKRWLARDENGLTKPGTGDAWARAGAGTGVPFKRNHRVHKRTKKRRRIPTPESGDAFRRALGRGEWCSGDLPLREISLVEGEQAGELVALRRHVEGDVEGLRQHRHLERSDLGGGGMRGRCGRGAVWCRCILRKSDEKRSRQRREPRGSTHLQTGDRKHACTPHSSGGTTKEKCAHF